MKRALFDVNVVLVFCSTENRMLRQVRLRGRRSKPARRKDYWRLML